VVQAGFAQAAVVAISATVNKNNSLRMFFSVSSDFRFNRSHNPEVRSVKSPSSLG
jgi:hypothetical protein